MMSDESITPEVVVEPETAEAPVEAVVEETTPEVVADVVAPEPVDEVETPVAAEAPAPVEDVPVAVPAKPAKQVKAAVAAEVAPVQKKSDMEIVNFEGNPNEVKPRGRRKIRQGRVVSNKMQKTIVVLVETRVRHPLYGKFMRRSEKFKAHDEQNVCGEGDVVEIMETRPLSKDKNWRLLRIVEKAK
jgi:small subunit ribosomal protein S17